jgi:hypothetical protein
MPLTIDLRKMLPARLMAKGSPSELLEGTMENQYIGQMSTAEGPLSAMLCIDSDRPTEFMIQWSGESPSRAGGCGFNAAFSGTSITLTPRVVYEVNQLGGLFAPAQLSDDQKKWVRESSAQLETTATGLAGQWSGPNGSSGSVVLDPYPVPAPIIAHQCATWSDFKNWADQRKAEKNGQWFRGHGDATFPLRTTLHRLGRYRLERYVSDELIRFNSQAEAVLNRRLHLNDKDEYSTVMGLARHHGMPTPLLDWTASPYIAAFFAFSDAIENRSSRASASKVRIFALSSEFVMRLSAPTIVLPFTQPYINALTIGPLHNPRLSAQQGGFLVTNVGNIESHIKEMERHAGVNYIFAADVPASLAPQVLKDLAFMGLTASTMFPGLDGMGLTIKHEMLFDQPT